MAQEQKVMPVQVLHKAVGQVEDQLKEFLRQKDAWHSFDRPQIFDCLGTEGADCRPSRYKLLQQILNQRKG